MSNIHSIKCWPEFFDQLNDHDKNFEIRKADKPYAVVDTLMIKEFIPGGGIETRHKGKFTGSQKKATITYILRGPTFGLMDGWVVLGLKGIH